MERAAYQMRFLSILWNSIEIPKETKAIHGESCCKMSTAAFFFAKVQKALQADKNFRKCQNMNMEVVMTKHETREYAFLLLYEAMVRAEELTTIEDLYASTEEMLELPMEKWMKITANPPMAGWTAAKILWIRENEPELFAKCRHIMLPKDYVRFILTGKYATDASDASGMQMLDVKNRCWSQEILDFLKVDRELLGDVYESPEVVGNLLPKIAEKCGLSTETVVVAGGSDNACAAIGTGIVREGQAFTTIGTSSIVYTHLKKYQEIPEGALHLCCCAVPGCWHTMGGPQSAGLSIEWMKNNFCQDLIQKAEEENVSFYDKINELTKDIPIGSERLIYLPFLMGERTPHIDPKYRGAFIGLNIIHGQAHMLRAIMEGVVYSLADCNEILKKLGTEVVSMRACGGGSRSPVWRKIMADLYKCDVHTLKQEEGPAYGAAILAGVGTGIYSSIQEACDAFIEEDGITECDLKEAEEYEKFHKIYDRFYEDIKENLHALYEL